MKMCISLMDKWKYPFPAWDIVAILVTVTVYSSYRWSDPEDEDSTFLQSVRNYLPSTTLKRHWTLASSVISWLRNWSTYMALKNGICHSLNLRLCNTSICVRLMDCETYIRGVIMRVLFGCHCVFWSLCYIVCLHVYVMLHVSVYTKPLFYAAVILLKKWA
jgi:hypothetical protein